MPFLTRAASLWYARAIMNVMPQERLRSSGLQGVVVSLLRVSSVWVVLST